MSVITSASSLQVPAEIVRPNYAATGQLQGQTPPYVIIHSDEHIQALYRAGQIARRMLELTCSLVEEGISTDDIDRQVHDQIIAEGAYPAPLNYLGFPKSVCASVNEEICHGIPNDRTLRAGDIAKFDVSIYTSEGFFGDNCATVTVGEVDARGQELVTVTAEALNTAIAGCVR